MPDVSQSLQGGLATSQPDSNAHCLTGRDSTSFKLDLIFSFLIEPNLPYFTLILRIYNATNDRGTGYDVGELHPTEITAVWQ